MNKLAKAAPQGKVYGVDFSGASVAVSWKTNARFVLTGRVELRNASVTQLPFCDGMFDLVTAVETHFWWGDLSGGLREIRRVLKPGGKFVLIAEVYKGAGTTMAVNCEKSSTRTGMKVLTPEEHRDLFIDAGYSDVQIALDKKKGWICATGASEAELRRYGT